MILKRHIKSIFYLVILLLVFSKSYAGRFDKDIRINEVYIKGNSEFSHKEIEKYIRFDHKGILNLTKVYSSRIMALNLDQISRKYQSQGYLNAVIKDSLVSLNEMTVDVYINIQENEQFFLREFSVVGNNALSDEEIYDILDIQIDKPFKPFYYQGKINELFDKYGIIGMPLVEIKEHYSDTPDMIWDIEIGNERVFTIGSIDIQGNTNINNSVIERELIIHEQDTYNLFKLKESRKRIYELGAFNNVNIIPETGKSGNQTLDLNITVSEALRRTWDMNLGFRQGRIEEVNQTYVFSQLDWMNRNLFRRAKRFGFSMSFNVLWNQIKTFDTIQPSYNIELHYTEPWVMFLRLPTTFKLYYKKDVYSPFNQIVIDKNDELTTSGFEISSLWKYREMIQILGSFTLRQVESILAIDEKEKQQKFGLQARFDNRDSFLYPHMGYNFIFESQFISGIGNNASNYTMWSASLSRYFAVSSQTTLAVRAATGQIYQTNDNEPLYALFRLGTETTVRGWSQSIGDEYTTATGLTIHAGFNKVLANMEYRFKLIGSFGGELFFDAGKLNDNYSSISEMSQYYISAGIGLTYNTYIGPVRVEMPFVVQDPGGKRQFGDKTEIPIILALLFAY